MKIAIVLLNQGRGSGEVARARAESKFDYIALVARLEEWLESFITR